MKRYAKIINDINKDKIYINEKVTNFLKRVDTVIIGVRIFIRLLQLFSFNLKTVEISRKAFEYF